MAFASVATNDYVITKGGDQIGSFASSDSGRRLFCGNCGTPLLMRDNDEPKTVDFSIATLDTPDRVAPGFHIFYSSRIAWAEAADTLPRHDRLRPDA